MEYRSEIAVDHRAEATKLLHCAVQHLTQRRVQRFMAAGYGGAEEREALEGRMAAAWVRVALVPGYERIEALLIWCHEGSAGNDPEKAATQYRLLVPAAGGASRLMTPATRGEQALRWFFLEPERPGATVGEVCLRAYRLFSDRLSEELRADHDSITGAQPLPSRPTPNLPPAPMP